MNKKKSGVAKAATNEEAIRRAIEAGVYIGNGQACDVEGVLRELDRAGFVIVKRAAAEMAIQTASLDKGKAGRPRIGAVREQPWLTCDPPMSKRTWNRRLAEKRKEQTDAGG